MMAFRNGNEQGSSQLGGKRAEATLMTWWASGWGWQAVDGVLTKAPFGHAATGATPTARGKAGTTRSLLTDGAGMPLALVVDGASRHEVRLRSATRDGLVISRPEPRQEQPHHLCLDAAYDSTPVYQDLLARQ